MPETCSLGGELGVRVELQESTLLTTKGADGQTGTKRRFGRGPEGLLGLAGLPTGDQDRAVGIIGHKALDHLASAFGTVHTFVSGLRRYGGLRLSDIEQRRPHAITWSSRVELACGI